MSGYLRRATMADCACALIAGLLAFEVRLEVRHYLPIDYLALSLTLPALWWATVRLAGGYDPRFIGAGSDEFHRILNAGVCLTAGVAIVSYAGKIDLARSYVVIAIPCATAFDLAARYGLRKQLHRLRRLGSCMRRAVAVGHTTAVAELVTQLRRDKHHGLAVVAACLADAPPRHEVAGVPVCGGLDDVADAVEESAADTVAVLTCPELNGVQLRDLAWQLEKRGTDLCVAPALLDVAGPRTTIRPVAGLPLLHLDHPQLSGTKQIVKGVFDAAFAATALIFLLPVFLAVALAIRLGDGGRVFFRQTRVGKNGHTFKVWKFRTMVEDAEQRKALLAARNQADGLLFKIHDDPRVTKVGGWLRRWSLDELPQLINVLDGDMSLVGPRPALPEEAALYGYHVRRRLAVKPGITGLWQVSGRANLSWEESVRVDLRYVENWSFALDLQILWKTWQAVIGRSGAY